MNKYIISIVFPVYNVENYIRESLNSALNQTFESIEFLIVDDCGTDNSMCIVESIVKSHQRGADVRIVRHSKNKGLSEARNTGIKETTGKYIFFMDSDDEITSDCIMLHYNKIVKYDADFTVANMELRGSRSIHSITKKFEIKEGVDVLRSFLCREWMTSGWNKLYKRSFLSDNNLLFIPGKLHEDIAWCYDIAKYAKVVSAVSKSTYIYMIRDNSITTSKIGKKRIADFYYMINHIYSGRKMMDISIVKSFDHYITYLKFKVMTMLLNSILSYSEQVEIHKKIKAIESPKATNIKTLLLSLPFGIFKIVVTIPLYLYKKSK